MDRRVEKFRRKTTFWPACTNTGFVEGWGTWYHWQGKDIAPAHAAEELMARAAGGYKNPRLADVPTEILEELWEDSQR